MSTSEKMITIIVTTIQPRARCPRCHQASTRIHSRSMRTVADLPGPEATVRWALQTRRFFCRHPAWAQQIFCERLPVVGAPYARRPLRLAQALQVLGFARGGEAGGRVARALSLPISPDPFPRAIRRAVLPPRPPPRVLGVDAWAKRKAHSSGTIRVD
jgi:transposase